MSRGSAPAEEKSRPCPHGSFHPGSAAHKPSACRHDSGRPSMAVCEPRGQKRTCSRTAWLYDTLDSPTMPSSARCVAALSSTGLTVREKYLTAESTAADFVGPGVRHISLCVPISGVPKPHTSWPHKGLCGRPCPLASPNSLSIIAFIEFFAGSGQRWSASGGAAKSGCCWP